MTNFSKLMELGGREWRYLGTALVLLPVLRASLRVFGFRSVVSALQKLAPESPLPAVADDHAIPAPHTDAEPGKLVHMVNVAATRGPVKANCLPRSLAIWWLLRRRGYGCELRIGVKPGERDFQAHAWVEYRGQVLNDEPEIADRFRAFARVVPERRRTV